MKLVPEHPFGPPEVAYFTEITDIPGLTLHPHGAGKGILIPWSIGAFYQGEGYTNTLNVIQDCLLYTSMLCFGGVELAFPGFDPCPFDGEAVSVQPSLGHHFDILLIELVMVTGVAAWLGKAGVRHIFLQPVVAVKVVSLHLMGGGRRTH